MSGAFRFLRFRAGAVGLLIVVVIVGVALIGPWFAPHPPSYTVAQVGAKPGSGLWLGADVLGRDVLSRLLWGGRSVLALGVLATVGAYLLGVPLGLAAGYSRSFVEPVIMRTVDVLRAFPPLLFFLIFIAALGRSVPLLIVAVAVTQVTPIARIVYTATLGVSVRGYVEAAVARGERSSAVVRREVFPNILGPLIADAGLRLSFSILLLAAVNFLGLGLQPPRADWALMISENREIVGLNVWAIAAPAIVLGLLTVGLNLVGDAISRSLGQSSATSRVRRLALTRGGRSLGLRSGQIEPVSGRVLSVTDLVVALDSGETVVEGVSFDLQPGQTLGLVGESGSGKTTVALALLGYVRRGMTIRSGRVLIKGETLNLANEREARRLRGRLISYIPQDPTTSLNPSMRVGDVVRGMLREHVPSRSSLVDVANALQRVHLPTDAAFARRYPHQLSGGQQQRVAIAAALAAEPPVVVLDEPTTGLDVVTQSRILREIDRLKRERGIAMVYVSHDLAVVSQVADRIAVMYAGHVVEEGPADELLRSPKHPYTRGLVASIPDHLLPHRLRGMPGIAVGVHDRPAGCPFAPRCPQRTPQCAEMPPLVAVSAGHAVACWEWQRTPELDAGEPIAAVNRSAAPPVLVVDGLHAMHKTRGGPVVAADGISFSISAAECVALVGESGSGKTTIARTIAGLHPPTGGTITLHGAPLAPTAKGRPQELRRLCQIVFQNPYESLNPRRRIGEEIARPAHILRGLSARNARDEVARFLELVRLPASLAERFPGELSGGERQRVAIARALAAKPDVLICDEITSALDVSVQAAVIELLNDLRAEFGMALLFITHDLGVVASIADQVLVLANGELRERGATATVIQHPGDRHTQELIAAAPRLTVRAPLGEARIER